MNDLFVVDTSVVIERAVSRLIKKKEIMGTIIIPNAVVAELEHQANKGQETGLMGIEELQNLQELKKQGEIELKFVGQRPNLYQIRYAKAGGEIDALIRDLAHSEGATLITGDKIQAESAKAFDINVIFIQTQGPVGKLEIESFFDDKTMSVHLKEDCAPAAKKGGPGDWKLIPLQKENLNTAQVQKIAKEIVENTRSDPKAFIEISRKGSTIIQYHNYRIVITKPPISDGWEITAVRPIKRLTLEDYNLPETIFERIKNKARGIIVAGETGSGKSTFAQAIAEFYADEGKITKTVESPRDLQLSDKITKYSKNFTSSEELHDILFLSRPDNILFDEIRDTPDFTLYIDLRLAGSNCLGVLHSASPIDAVQRFISRMDTGMIPSVIDTIIFIEKGKIGKVLTLAMTVKVPSGMTEADLARPVVEIRDFETNSLLYEIYSYGEQTVVIPVGAEKHSPARQLAAKQVEKEIRKYSSEAKVEVVSDHRAVVYVPADEIARIIGKQGKTIEEIEKKIGISITVNELAKQKGEKKLRFEIRETGKAIGIYTEEPNKLLDIYVGDNFLFSATTSKKGEINVNKKSKLGQAMSKIATSKREIKVLEG